MSHPCRNPPCGCAGRPCKHAIETVLADLQQVIEPVVPHRTDGLAQHLEQAQRLYQLGGTMPTLLLHAKPTEGLGEPKHAEKGENIVPDATFNTCKLG